MDFFGFHWEIIVALQLIHVANQNNLDAAIDHIIFKVY